MHNIMLWTLQDGLHILRTDDILVFPSMIIVCTDYTLFFFFFFFFFLSEFPLFQFSFYFWFSTLFWHSVKMPSAMAEP